VLILKFTERLRKLRKSKKLSQQKLADKLELSRSAISSWEQGVTEPTIKHIVDLAYVFNCTVDYLLSVDSRKYVEVTNLKDGDIIALKTIISSLEQSK
jgi:transcriptional regulator with XRE-family HTH domain